MEMVSEDVERLIVIRKMTCGRLREAKQRRVGEATLSQLWEDYRRSRKEVKKSYIEREEGIEAEDNEEDQRAGWHELITALD